MLVVLFLYKSGWVAIMIRAVRMPQGYVVNGANRDDNCCTNSNAHLNLSTLTDHYDVRPLR